MSAISRLLRWAPCFWAISKVANSSGQVQRSQVFHPQFPSYERNGPLDVLQSLSFSARTVVHNAHIARAAPPPSVPRGLEANGIVGRNVLPRWLPSWLRHNRPEVHMGWRWENPPFSVVLKLHNLYQRASSRILTLISQSTNARIPRELEHAVLLSLVRSTRRFGADVSVETRLVCKQWDQDLRRAYWKRRWLNIRPTVASWGKVGERLRLLIEQAPLIHKVKLDNVLTDIVPTSSVCAEQKCPELGRLAQCQIKEIKVGRLDMLNEVILKCMLSSHQGRLRHFAFRAKDAVLFRARRSIFAKSNLHMPKLRKITIDISTSPNDDLADDVHGSMAAHLAGELAGGGRDAKSKKMEVTIFCMPDVPDPSRPFISTAHLTLARSLVTLVNTIMQDRHITVLVSFEGPLASQAQSTISDIVAWAETNDVRLINTPAPNNAARSIA